MASIREFLYESNKIERIKGVREGEVEAAEVFLELPVIIIEDLQRLVMVFEPGALLRNSLGMDVQVGKYLLVQGGWLVVSQLAALLDKVNGGRISAYEAHVDYECIHPFMDGNGRSGRMLWLWQMRQGGSYRIPNIGFLQAFYYQTLAFEHESRGA